MAKRYELNDEQWARIANLLPGKKSDPGRTAADNRLFVNGVLWILRSGAQWDELPERYGKWKSVHKRFTRWAKAGVCRQPDCDPSPTVGFGELPPIHPVVAFGNPSTRRQTAC